MDIRQLYTKIKSQSGRTMTEIIGVIAVIGVLSLAGLYGYNYAMENVRENETLNRASKIIAGARTSYILQNLGDATKYYQPGDTLPAGKNVGDLRNEYQSQPINMNDVISNIGDDFSADGTYILAPLKGPFKDGTEENVKIYVRVETPQAFTVRFENLTKQACVKIVMAQNLGYSWAFEDDDHELTWLDATATANQANAEALCDRVIGAMPSRSSSAAYNLFLNNPFIKQAVAQTTNPSGTLVLWFGPHGSMENVHPGCSGDGCCCDTDADGNTYLVGRVGCAMPAGGSCVACAVNDGSGNCVQREGVTCPTTDVCHTQCSGETPVECGNKCCKTGEVCKDGVCVRGTVSNCDEDQKECGDLCCESDEICSDGKCIPDPCPQDQGYFWCVQDQVCCKPGQRCQNGTCVNACASDEVACGTDECCKTANNEICNQGRCVQINPLCQRKDWLPHYVGQVPEHSCTGVNGEDCCYDGEECCNGLCCIYGYTCKNNSCVWAGGDDAECAEECPGTPGDPRSGGGVKYVDSEGNEKCCCHPREVQTTNGRN